jgi:hypothetical protein
MSLVAAVAVAAPAAAPAAIPPCRPYLVLLLLLLLLPAVVVATIYIYLWQIGAAIIYTYVSKRACWQHSAVAFNKVVLFS